MAQRTTRSSVSFDAPFRLMGYDDPFPAGTYDVDTEEEIVEGNERTVYLRVATVLCVRTTGKMQLLTVDPSDLSAALASDQARLALGIG